MNEKLRRALIIINIAVISFCILAISNSVYQNKRSEEIYAETNNLVSVPEFPSGSISNDSNNESSEITEQETDSYAESLLNMRLDELKNTNKDVIGWIIIPGTNISYPIVQSKDNKYYLRRAWTGEKNNAGSIFMDYHSSKDFDSFNSIIYGHLMKNGTMFAALKNYENQNFMQENPYIYIVTENSVLRYDIFSAFEADVKSKKAFRMVFATKEDKEEYISYCKENSVLKSDITPNKDDYILTLSTCTGNGYSSRWVVQGVLKHNISRYAKYDNQ